ncbi:MAG TPA: hypothetical protein VGI93_21060 [Steroidobacteraceae bacterium]|jgi:hypothetical protein
MMLLIEIVGWTGAVLVLAAYGLLSLEKLPSSSASYQLMNLFGSTGLAINSFWNGAYPSVGLNIIWMGIGVFAVFKMAKRWARPSSN